MRRVIMILQREERGADMIEYGLVAVLVSVVALVTVQAIGPFVVDMWTEIQTALGG